MSDLVERVARAMCLSCDVDPDYVSDGKIMWHRFDKDARAAIAAVAEWLEHRDPDHWHSAEMMRFTARKLEEQLEQPKND